MNIIVVYLRVYKKNKSKETPNITNGGFMENKSMYFNKGFKSD